MFHSRITASKEGNIFKNNAPIETKLVKSETVSYPKENIGFMIFSDLFADGFLKERYDLSNILIKGIKGDRLDPVEKLIFAYINKSQVVRYIKSSISPTSEEDQPTKPKRGRPRKNFSFSLETANSVLNNDAEIESIKSDLLKSLSDILYEKNDYGLNIGEELLDKLPRNEKIDIYDSEGRIKPEYKKPTKDNVVPEDYYKSGELADIYYPYAFRSGPDNPAVNHNITRYDAVFKRGFDLFEKFLDGVMVDMEKFSSEDVSVSLLNAFNKTGIIEKLLDIFKSAEEEGMFVCDMRVLASFDFMPNFVIYSEDSVKQSDFVIDSIVCGFLSNEIGHTVIFQGENLQQVKHNSVKKSFYDVSFYHKKGYFNQYSAIKKAICTSAFSKFYDDLSDFVYDRYLKQYDKYSTIHNLFVANLFALMLFMDSNGFGEKGMIKAPICKVNAKISYIDDVMAIEDFSIILDASNKIEGVSTDTFIDFDYPIISIFADTSEFDAFVENAFCVVSKRNSSASVDEIHEANIMSDDIEVR